MNRAVTYQFTIRAVTPAYFGDSKQGELVRNAHGQPLVLGNAIGGALRDYLNRNAIPEELILKSMGGDQVSAFKESNLYISDGIVVCSDEVVKEGTAIDPQYGSAKDKHKYTLYHFPEGSEITFRIESDELIELIDLDDSSKQNDGLLASELEQIIGTWAEGLDTRQLRLGGQKSNGFGAFEIKELRKREFRLDSIEELERYIFDDRDKGKGISVDWKTLNRFQPKSSASVTFSMNGCFPYGVYQNFKLNDPSCKDMTGLLYKQGKYYIPSTSLKGLIKNEIRLLLKRMKTAEAMNAQELDEFVEHKCAELFGSIDQRGRLVFSDAILEKTRLVEIDRNTASKKDGTKAETCPVYIKIDRLTGGAYSSALKHQQEIQGETNIRLSLALDDIADGELSPYIFPLIYVLRRIGAGDVPIGGRTVIGLGQFAANMVEVDAGGERWSIETNELSDRNRNWLEACYESFKGWCNEDAAYVV
ncbi:RAMP superfamily CRISPR-associated protein [Paenibacillus sp. MER TA 81-3]|uniref:RAMP superfamily CRISPR-associated protein n=1 Tax=Paenibacillus sp. MER TA 81-3 TaxID=2939573 RepID=UPI00203AF504|nr:RAMP superfamily CRISPR-associated protein [Paenibacillus sp. MER TA 81-3]MCM3341558.1 RAMP superfamily CRISPR-associated protein [Paenibacillus sp. MER TA 81-3]